jgi:uncharacterized protein YoxC
MGGLVWFYVVVAFSFVALASGMIYLAVRLTKTLNKVDHILAEVKEVTDEIDIFKKGLKMGLMTLITSLVGKLTSKPKEVKLNG